jgi:hypothetical protein
MARYKVNWCKTYYVHGDVEIEANSKEEAEEIVLDEIGDYTGSMLYAGDLDFVEVLEITDMCNEDEWVRSSEQTIKEMCNE